MVVDSIARCANCPRGRWLREAAAEADDGALWREAIVVKSRRKVGAVATCLAILLAGSANASHANTPARTTGASPAPAFIYLGPQREHEVFAPGEFVYDPPPEDARPAISPATAFALCVSWACVAHQTAHITLAEVTTPNAGDMDSAGAITPLIDHDLTYVLTWSGVPCHPLGGDAVNAARLQAQTYVCTNVVLIRATTGAVAYGVSGTN